MTDNDKTTTGNPRQTDDGPTCTLPADAMAERADWIRKTVEPHLLEVVVNDEGLILQFERNTEAYEAVSGLLWKEATCCAFAGHELRVPADADRIEWHWTMDDEGTNVLREANERFDVLEIPN